MYFGTFMIFWAALTHLLLTDDPLPPFHWVMVGFALGVQACAAAIAYQEARN